jgi:hypothetical protein
MTITFANAVFTTTITGNEIQVAPTSGSIMEGASAPRLGYTTDFGASATWQNPIWFRFCEPIAASEIPLGTLRTFQTIDIENIFGSSIQGIDIDAMLVILFMNYYTDPTIRAALEAVNPYFVPMFQRLAGETPTTAWSTTFPVISSSGLDRKSIALFQDFGVGYTVSSKLVNTSDYSIGTLFKEVHVTQIDPLADATAFPAKYRYLSSTRQNASATVGNRTQGMIIHTNLWTDAFSAPGMTNYFQFLAMAPILSRILYDIDASGVFNPMAYVNSLLDSTMLQKGAGYFNRSSRVNTTFGWFGNSIVGFLNDISGCPTILPFIGFSEFLAIKNMVNTNFTQSLPFTNSIPCIWTGVNQASNFTRNSAKAYVRLIMYYAALIQRYGNLGGSIYISQTETNLQSALGITPATYYQEGANALAVGEYGHFFRFAQTVSNGSGSTIFAAYVQPYLSWQANVSSLQLVALDKVSTTTRNAFLSPISNLSTYYSAVGSYTTSMTAGEETNLTNYTYP